MGTLGNQEPRDHRRVKVNELDEFLTKLVRLATKHDISVGEVIEAKRVMEFERQNDLACDDGDYRDEQMGGFGDRLERLVESLGDVAESIRESFRGGS